VSPVAHSRPKIAKISPKNYFININIPAEASDISSMLFACILTILEIFNRFYAVELYM
jgi:hypothetical protein